jgi:hypothetical protein
MYYQPPQSVDRPKVVYKGVCCGSAQRYPMPTIPGRPSYGISYIPLSMDGPMYILDCKQRTGRQGQLICLLAICGSAEGHSTHWIRSRPRYSISETPSESVGPGRCSLGHLAPADSRRLYPPPLSTARLRQCPHPAYQVD